MNHKFSLAGSFLNSNERNNGKKPGHFLKNEPESPRDYREQGDGDQDSDMKDNKKSGDNQRNLQNSPFTSALIGNCPPNAPVSSFVSPYMQAQRHPSFRNERDWKSNKYLDA